MESSQPSSPDPEPFFDALDEFPFFDCSSTPLSNPQPSPSLESSNISHLESQPSALCRRFSLDNKNIQPMQHQTSTPRERKNKILSALKDHSHTNTNNHDDRDIDIYTTFSKPETVVESSSSNIENIPATSSSLSSSSNPNSNSNSSVLVFLSGLVIKAIGFQLSLLLKFFTFPIWFSYCSFLLIADPFGIVKRVKARIRDEIMKVCNGFFEKVKEQKSVWKLAVKFGWGFLWSVYICFVLFSFLVGGFVIGGVVMKYLVEEPIQLRDSLNFDYTKSSPMALVPIMECPSVSCGENCMEIDGEHVGGGRFIPPNHKFQVTVELMLPESDYNRNLGIFQVRVDFLSEKGEVTATSKHPCMLRFKSHGIRYIETFLKSVPLLAGYSSEAQVLNIKMKGFTEGYRPTSCLRVILEQRAEYRSGGGIPEIYSASVLLESELPLFKRILWYWKRTVYIWISMVLFMTELMFVLVCCRPFLVPRVRHRDGSANNRNPQNTVPAISN